MPAGVFQKNYSSGDDNQSMNPPRQLYRRLDSRIQDLSRVSYALLIGLISAVGVFTVRSLLPGDGSFGPIALGIAMTVVYYMLDPNNNN